MLGLLCVDVANGYTEKFLDSPQASPRRQPRIVIMAGNVVTGEMTEELILDGADIVKVGIGPGSVCTTRKMAGVGYPQLSAIIECADAAHGLEGLICADGGCTSPGDIAKAFGAGADFVMLGGMLAGHDECAGESATSSTTARPSHGLLRHVAQRRWKNTPAASPITAPRRQGRGDAYRGPVDNTMQEIIGRRALGLHLRRRDAAQGGVQAHDVRAGERPNQRHFRRIGARADPVSQRRQ